MHTSRTDTPPAGAAAGLPLRRRLRGESGVAIVEFALILPFLCLMIVLMLDVGRAFNYWIDTTHLAAEGARLAAVDKVPTGSTSLQQFIRSKASTDELANGGSDWIKDPLEVCVNSAPGSRVGDPVEVTVTTSFKWTPLLGLATSEIHGSATMRREVAANHVTSVCG